MPLLARGSAGGDLPCMVLILTATLVHVVGFIDDNDGVRAPVKLLAEMVLASALALSGLRIERLGVPGLGTWELGPGLSIGVTVAWITTVTNAMNLIDGLDGLAGGVSIVTAVALLAIGLAAGDPFTVLLGSALIGATLAFLRHNLRSGSIFLGDSGSLFLGFLLAGASVHLGQVVAAPFFPGAGLLLMGLPLVEIATTVIRRVIYSESLCRGARGLAGFLRRELMRADAGHLHHCLIRRGLNAAQAAAVLVGGAAIYCLLAVAYVVRPERAFVLWLLAMATTVLGFIVMRPFAAGCAVHSGVRAPRGHLEVIAGGAERRTGAAPEAESAAEQLAA